MKRRSIFETLFCSARSTTRAVTLGVAGATGRSSSRWRGPRPTCGESAHTDASCNPAKVKGANHFRLLLIGAAEFAILL